MSVLEAGQGIDKHLTTLLGGLRLPQDDRRARPEVTYLI